jgi:N-methylhydantoinase A
MAVSALFHEAHQQRFGYRLAEGELLEVVTLRVTAVAPTDPPVLPKASLAAANAAAAVVGQKQVWFKHQPQPATLYDREKLRPGNQFTGPAIVFQYDTTLVIPPGWETAVDPYMNLILTVMP